MESRPQILLVDDLPLYRRMLPLRLGPMAKDVITAAGPEEALESIRRHRPLLLLLDVVMPGKDGFTFCRELKADRNTGYLSIIMLTALTGDAFSRSLEAGADDYLPKRVEDAVLRVRTHLHLNLQHLRLKNPGWALSQEPADMVLVSRSLTLQAQIPAQCAQEGHRTRVITSLERLGDHLRATDRLLILDTAVDPEGIPETLVWLRADPETHDLPVLLLCEKSEMEKLQNVESTVDDILWKPLNPKVTRFRLHYLLELGARVAQANQSVG